MPDRIRGLFRARVLIEPAAKGYRLVRAWRPTVSLIQDGLPDFSLPQLGIAFVVAPERAEVGETFECAFRLLVWPDPVCDHYIVGASFAVMEGKTVVSTGEILSIDGAE